MSVATVPAPAPGQVWRYKNSGRRYEVLAVTPPSPPWMESRLVVYRSKDEHHQMMPYWARPLENFLVFFERPL